MKRNLEKHVVRISAHQLEDFMDRKLHLRAAGRTGETLSRAVLNLCQGQIRSARTTFEFNPNLLIVLKHSGASIHATDCNSNRLSGADESISLARPARLLEVMQRRSIIDIREAHARHR
jgi:hypothetical protein